MFYTIPVINMDSHSDRNLRCILQASTEVLEEDNTSIWFSGKEMLRGKQLKDFIGKNEKTKIVAKIQKVLKKQLGILETIRILLVIRF